MQKPTIIPADQHDITDSDISIEAKKVISRLQSQGFSAYVVGGAVRDLLLGLHPKDFDIVTEARPEQVKKVFRNCRIIGRRFKLAHVYFRDDIIEVSTFRRYIKPTDEDSPSGRAFQERDGLVVRDNVYGTPEEDAWRRDFTVNALLLDTSDFTIRDYTDGMADIRARLIRSLGKPRERYIEDPVRMIRAVRLAAKLGFEIEKETRDAISENREQLMHASNARMYDEIQKLFLGGYAAQVFEGLQECGLMPMLFPDLNAHLETEEEHRIWVQKVMRQLDRWRAAGFHVTPELMFSLLFGYFHEHEAERLAPGDSTPPGAMMAAAREHMRKLGERMMIPKAVIAHITQIMGCQSRFQRKRVKRLNAFKSRLCFHDAFIYFKFRSKFYDNDHDALSWWEKQI